MRVPYKQCHHMHTPVSQVLMDGHAGMPGAPVLVMHREF